MNLWPFLNRQSRVLIRLADVRCRLILGDVQCRDDFVLPLAQATSMALVLNELIQNAVEHGFKTLNDGRIKVQLSETETERRVTVINDGDKLPDGFKPDASSSLGLSIVETLVRGDLQGAFTLENAVYDNGIIAIVTFPRK